MKYKIILCVALISSLAIAQSDKVFVLFMNIHNDDRVEFINFEVISGTPNIEPLESGTHPIKIISFDNKVVFESALQINFKTFRETIDENGTMSGEEVELESVEKYLRLPYFADAKSIELYHGDNLIYTLNVADYLCNKNNVCEENENAQNCPSDCRTTTTIPPGGKDNTVLLIAGILLIILGIVIAYFLLKRRSESRESGILRKLS